MIRLFVLFVWWTFAAAAFAQEGITSRVTPVLFGSFSEGWSTAARTSRDGRFTVFQSRARNLVYRDFSGNHDIFIRDSLLGITECLSRRPDGESTYRESTSPDVSDNGRYVVFVSDAGNLVAGDTNEFHDIFLRDRVSRKTTRLSMGMNGAETNSGSFKPRISGDGKYVVFLSYATNLIANQTSGFANAFRYSMETGVTESVSLADDGSEGNSDVTTADIDQDGDRIAFASRATNLVEVFSFFEHVYLRDITAGSTTRASTNGGGEPANAWSGEASISANGNVVAFESSGTNLVTGDFNSRSDVFARNLSEGTTKLVSLSTAGVQSDRHCYNASASQDGRFISFNTESPLMVPGDTNNAHDVFLRDTTKDSTLLVSRPHVGGTAAGRSQRGSVADNGTTIVFDSEAGNILKGDANNGPDTFAFDTKANVTVLASVRAVDAFGDFGSISSNGRYVAFTSTADNLVPINEHTDHVFVHDRLTGMHKLATVSSSGLQANGPSDSPVISADGSCVVFSSWSYNLVPNDTNWDADIFVHDLRTNQTTRVSVSSAGNQANGQSHSPSISSDGRFIAFVSSANNLVEAVPGGVFVHDRLTGETTIESRTLANVPGRGDNPHISAEGRFIVFEVPPGYDPQSPRKTVQIYLRDRLVNTVEHVSIGNGQPANGRCWQPKVSDDGRSVAFASEATNLVANDTNGCADVFVRDVELGTTVTASVSSTGEQATHWSSCDSISMNGRIVYFSTWSANIVPNDNNERVDAFEHDLVTRTTKRISTGPEGTESNGGSGEIFGAHPLAVVFTSQATNLIPFDTNNSPDVFVFDKRLTPDSIEVEAGNGSGEPLPLLRFSDDERFDLSSTLPAEVVSLVLERAAPTGKIETLQFEVESNVTVDGAARKVEFFNFDTQQYELLETGTALREDSSVVINVHSNAMRFLGPNNQMRARVTFTTTGINLLRWKASFDHVRWTVSEP
ncbi:MAG: hypothetical protein M3R13_00545 [Armatimonadota bacterium]|nr:hypothetical protein [Armatimonadota bacterium]